MQPETKISTIKITGMTCVHCEKSISKTLSRLPGVLEAKVGYTNGLGNICYDPEQTSLKDIYQAIEVLGYDVEEYGGSAASNRNNWLGILFIVFALYWLLQGRGFFRIFNLFPQAEAGMGYGMLFITGLFTSVHCVAMCGGINLSQCLPSMENKNSGSFSLRANFLYNSGRVVSYTVVGAIVGALGSVLAFSGFAKGIVQLAAGSFMIIMGLNMLNVFPGLRRLQPHLPSFLSKWTERLYTGNQPFIIGLFNGLMPCGPLQAMQLYALSTGSPVRGAASMLVFSLGTVPLMFGLGALSIYIGRKFTANVMKFGAALVVILGLSMFNNGLALSGLGIGMFQMASGNSTAAQVVDEVQTVNTTLSSRRYEPITVTKGIPVHWTITAEQGTVNGCNNRIFIPEYDIEKQLTVGENIIEFLPEESGVFTYSCWMGMIRSTISVTEADGVVPAAGEQEEMSISPGINRPGSILPGYEIPVDQIGVAEYNGSTQVVSIDIQEGRFSPAVIILQYGLEAEIKIQNTQAATESLFFPLYGVQVTLEAGENTIYVMPETDFEFLAGDFSFYGYVKVVDDLGNINLDQIKKEVSGNV